MATELEANYPSSEIDIVAINEEGQDRDNPVAAALTDLPLLQDVDSNNDGDSDVWEDWGVAWRDVRIVDAQGELHSVYSLTTEGDLREEADYNLVKDRIIDAATSSRIAETEWQNRVEPLDVDNNKFVTPRDVLGLVNRINDQGAGQLVAAQESDSPYFDVSGDGFVSARDVLFVVLHLNNVNSSSAAGEPDAEAMQPEPVSSAADAYFASNNFQDNDDDDDDDDGILI